MASFRINVNCNGVGCDFLCVGPQSSCAGKILCDGLENLKNGKPVSFGDRT